MLLETTVDDGPVIEGVTTLIALRRAPSDEAHALLLFSYGSLHRTHVLGLEGALHTLART